MTNKDLIEKLYEKVDELAKTRSEDSAQIATMVVLIDEIKEDIKYHIMRTDLNEDRIHRLERIEQYLRGAFYVVCGVCTLALTVFKIFY